jgi:hypothetical protein
MNYENTIWEDSTLYRWIIPYEITVHWILKENRSEIRTRDGREPISLHWLPYDVSYEDIKLYLTFS